MTKSIRKDIFNSCPECGGYIIFNQIQSEELCNQCGLVINENGFGVLSAGKKELEIIPMFKPRSYYKDYNEKRVHEKEKWGVDNNLAFAYAQIYRICSNLNLPLNVKKATKKLYTQTLKKGLVLGHSICGMVCACIFHVSKKYYSRSLAEISLQIKGLIKTRNLVKHVSGCYTVIFNKLSLKYQSKVMESLVARYVSEAGLDEGLVPLVIKLLKYVNAERFSNGKKKNGVVAAVIYIATIMKG